MQHCLLISCCDNRKIVRVLKNTFPASIRVKDIKKIIEFRYFSFFKQCKEFFLKLMLVFCIVLDIQVDFPPFLFFSLPSFLPPWASSESGKNPKIKKNILEKIPLPALFHDACDLPQNSEPATYHVQESRLDPCAAQQLHAICGRNGRSTSKNEL